MSPWDDLEAELDRWAAAGRPATFWWRDDDAAESSPALLRLMELSRTHGVPLALAVIPRAAKGTLGPLTGGEGVSVLQHGYAHRNHAPAHEKKCELGCHRPLARTLDELTWGRDRLKSLFGDRHLDVLVPPWNRIDPAVVARLGSRGYRGLSRYSARAGAFAVPGLLQINTHVDPIAWRVNRAFLGVDAAVALVLAHLSGRRRGNLDPREPTGLLTHHLDHDEACWSFVDELLARTVAHSAGLWLSAEAAFGPTCAR